MLWIMIFANRTIIYALIGGLAVSLFFNLMSYSYTQNLNQQLASYKEKVVSQGNVTNDNVQNKVTGSGYVKKSITAVAVRQVLEDEFFQEYRLEGTTLNITVEVRDGEGLILVNTETATGIDFQSSARTAAKVAQEFTHLDLSKKDIIFSISSSKGVVVADGPSAGAAMAVLLISALEGKELRNDVLITGTINPDGMIGKVGGVMEKAEAAGMHGAKKFLVPKGQSTVQVKTCEEKRSGFAVIVSCRYEPASLSKTVEPKYGMQVIEVENIKDALNQFIV